MAQIGSSEALRQHEEMKAGVMRALEVVDGVIEGGERWLNQPLPWADPMFQRAVVQRLRETSVLRRDSEKLAIVKEVFGSK